MTILLTRRKRRVVQVFLNLTVRQNVYSKAKKFFFLLQHKGHYQQKNKTQYLQYH